MPNHELFWLWIKPCAVLAGVLLAGWIFKTVLLRRLAAWAQKTETPLDDVLISILNKNLLLWFLLLGLALSLKYAPLPLATDQWLDKAALALFLISLSWAVAGIASVALEYYGRKVSLDVSALSLTQNLVKILIMGIGVLVIFSNLGVSITPLLTALGVGSLAVALALQDTLSNLFAGFYVVISRHIHAGDYIQLEGGQEGYVADIGWRSCTIRQLSGNLVIVPNQKLGQAIIVNYFKPAKDLGLSVSLGVAYGSDLERIEQVTLAVAEQVMREVPGGVPDFKPSVRFTAFGDSSIQFNVGLRAREFADRYLIIHEFIKRLHTRYLKEGIEIPFPQQVVHMAKNGK